MKSSVLGSTLLLLCTNIFAVGSAELLPAKSAGELVYYTCIVTPPVTSAQRTLCTGLYTKYISKLQIVAAPSILGLSHENSPYTTSIYDVCKYDASHFVFDDPMNQPYCPVNNFI